MIARALVPSRDDARFALGAAVLFALAFPPVPLVGPAFVCLAPLGVVIARQADRKADVLTSARVGFWFGLVAYGLAVHWIATALAIYTKLAMLGWLAAVLVLGMVLAGVGALLHVARRASRWPMAVLLPIVWVAGEVVLEHLGDLAFPWLPLGLASARLPVLLQVADLSGVHGASFWIAGINGLVADMFLERSMRHRAVAIASVVVLVASYGMWRMHSINLETLGRVAVVQPNVPQAEKWQAANQERIVGMLADGTRQAVATRPALVLWPEAALPDFLFRRTDWLDTLAHLTATSQTPLLIGALDVRFDPPRPATYYNGALLVERDGHIRQAAYRKRRLVPVVERVPFIEPRWVRSWSEYFGGYARGDSAVLLATPLGDAGSLICYEGIFPSLTREYRRRGATFLAILTNDAWFGRSFGPYQHLAHASVRAVETRLSVVRAANTGISAYVDPLGRVHDATELFVAATPAFDVTRTDTRTLYVRWGDWIGTMSIIGSAGLLAADQWRRHRASTEAA